MEFHRLSRFQSPNKVFFGINSSEKVGKEATALGTKRTLVVTDQGVIKAGLLDGVKKSLESEGISVSVFDGVEPDPGTRIANECGKAAISGNADLIVGIGGGSSIDVAKGGALLATNEGNIVDYLGVDKVPRQCLPTILIPTTSGTGSEVTRVLVVTDEEDRTKQVVFSDYLFARVAIIDPALTLSMPAIVTADTGIDALVHAIESYVCKESGPFSDMLALQAITLIAENLPRAFCKGSDLDARNKMALASCMAGLAFTSSGLGAVHALSYPLDSEFGISHGRSQGAILPYIIEFNRSGDIGKYAEIAKAMGEKINQISGFEATEKLIGSIWRLLNVLGISTRLQDYGITDKDIDTLVAGAMKQSRLFGPNPRDIVEDDVRNIYIRAFNP